MLDSTSYQIKLLRKWLKMKILEDTITFHGHKPERQHVYEMMKKAISCGESNSALVIGPRGCGKTVLINSVLSELGQELDLESDAIIVNLNGLLHHDDKIALKTITTQMQLENAVGDRVFGTFAENLSFLLSCLQTGASRRCRSMVFVLSEFDAFCHTAKSQTLLYNLFDVTQSGQAPVCVVGLTSRLDVMELLEKRVKSRFSHRHIFIFPNEDTATDSAVSPLDTYKRRLVQLLTLPLVGKKKARSVNVAEWMPKEVLERCRVGAKVDLNPDFVSDWNAHIQALVENESVVDTLEKLAYYTVNEQIFKDVLFAAVCKLSPARPFMDPAWLAAGVDDAVCAEHRVAQIHSLSVLELSLLIAMKQGMEVFDGQPMNFEMVLHRYNKYAHTHASGQTAPRPVVLKAFEHLQHLELVRPAAADSGAHKEYRLYACPPPSVVGAAVASCRALPTDVAHWFATDGI